METALKPASAETARLTSSKLDLPLWRSAISTDQGVLALSALSLIVLHMLTNGQYGFHRDELLVIDDARFLSWGYVVYPPLSPFIARLSLTLFGTSLIGFRFFAALAEGIAMLLTGLMVRELGGKRWAQLVGAWAAAIASVPLHSGAMFQYMSLDHLWWVLAAYFVVRLLESGNPRWWLGVGVAAGLGMMTKYTMAFFVLGILAGLIFTNARKCFASKWLWCGVAVSILIFLPNLLWQVQHNFLTLEFLRSIHARDVGIGRGDWFLPKQLYVCMSAVAVPLWVAGLYYLFVRPEGKRYRMIGWMFVVPMALLMIAGGREYYLAPAYPMILAAGAFWTEQWITKLPAAGARRMRTTAWSMLVVGGLINVALALPVAPAGSGWFKVSEAVTGNFNYEFGWPEMVSAVARVRDSLPAGSGRVAILTGDSGETGAIYVYGRAFGLPQAISGSNSDWLRGYGDQPPDTVITFGYLRSDLDGVFESCQLAGESKLAYGIMNHAVGADHNQIFVCRQPRKPWNEFWKTFRWFG